MAQLFFSFFVENKAELQKSGKLKGRRLSSSSLCSCLFELKTKWLNKASTITL